MTVSPEIVLQWACDISKGHKVYSADSPLRVEHFARVLKDKKFASLFGYLVRHIKHPVEKNNIKINVQQAVLKKKLLSIDDTQLSLHEREAGIRTSIIEAESRLAEEMKTVEEVGDKLNYLQQQENELRNKLCLMNLGIEAYKRELDLCSAWQKSIAKIMSVPGNCAGVKESHYETTVVKAMLDDIYSISCQHLPGTIWASLQQIVQNATEDLCRLTQQIDLARDAHDIKLLCQKEGTFIDDMGVASGTSMSLEESVVEMCGVHVKMSADVHSSLSSLQSHSNVLTSLYDNIKVMAERKCPEELLSALLSVIRGSISVAGLRAALQEVKNIGAELSSSQTPAERARRNLVTLQGKVALMDEKLHGTIQKIQCARCSIHEGKEGLRAVPSQVLREVDDHLGLVKDTLSVPKDVIEGEIKTFYTLPLGALYTVPLKRDIHLLRHDLSVTSPEWLGGKQRHLLGSLTDVLSLPAGTSWDSLLLSVASQKQNLSSLGISSEALDYIKGQFSAKKPLMSSDDIRALMTQIKRNDDAQDKEVDDVLSKCESLLMQSFKVLVRLRSRISNWHDQPVKRIQL